MLCTEEFLVLYRLDRCKYQNVSIGCHQTTNDSLLAKVKLKLFFFCNSIHYYFFVALKTAYFLVGCSKTLYNYWLTWNHSFPCYIKYIILLLLVLIKLALYPYWLVRGHAFTLIDFSKTDTLSLLVLTRPLHFSYWLKYNHYAVIGCSTFLLARDWLVVAWIYNQWQTKCNI